mgnify:CR=1 FL=1
MQKGYSNNSVGDKIDLDNDNFLGLLDSSNIRLKIEDYNLDKYIQHVNQYGLEVTWANILRYVKNNGESNLLNTKNFGELYELGLAERDKGNKKKSGQYYTPYDVSRLMSTWLNDIDGYNICDVGCGTGNLILSYLNLIGNEETQKLLKQKRIFLYDFDKIAITIAKYSIAFLYGIDYLDNINTIYGDFLNKNVIIPNNSKIISNPPYAKFAEVENSWIDSSIQRKTKELYAAFMEKILLSGNRAVIITPYSFLGGSKFRLLRNIMNNYNGYIIAFDNVPGNIFNGRKHGIFNTNTANSVRAAITVVENKPNIIGFRSTHLLRFKNKERKRLLKSAVLKSFLSNKYQIINNRHKKYERCHVQLEDCFENWKSKSSTILKDFISQNNEGYKLYMPNTCRYFTTASNRKLKRRGYITISLSDLNKYYFMYCMINSSFVYWWWRIYDGGITYPKGLLNSVPIFYDLLNDDDKKFFSTVAKEMINNESKYIITKLNAGVVHENIKFPKRYRESINNRFLEILSCQENFNQFELIHSNSIYNDL